MKTDSKIASLIKLEEQRQKNQLQLIASENYVSKNIKKALGSVLVNKYSEGLPTKRYYQGNEYIDQIELKTKERALKLFGLNPKVWDVNAQAVTGSVANLGVYTGLLKPGDKMLSMFLYDGGHLSHGWKLPDGKNVSLSSHFYDSYFYNVDPSTRVFDYSQIEKLAKRIRPKIIISGGTAYPREIDHKKMGDIAKKVGAYYMADIAHEAGLVAAKVNKSPFKYADVVTMTTRKTLRGPIGALIFSRHELMEKINRALFPGLLGGPQNHSIAAIGVCLHEANSVEFKKYAAQCIKNAKTLTKELANFGFEIVSGGTDKHLLLIDLTKKGIGGWETAWALEYAGIIANRSTVPQDSGSPYYPFGLRLGTPAVTTRGMGTKEMAVIARLITEVVELAIVINQKVDSKKAFKMAARKNPDLKKIASQIKKMCKKFPVP